MSEIPHTTDFSWHQKSWNQLTQANLKNQLPHAILLSGEEGIAKSLLAQRMAKYLLCMNTANSNTIDACNECQSCKTFESGANPDFSEVLLLEDKQQIGIDQIRSLSEFLNYSRSFNTNRVVIINPVERMNMNAANSLLKSLEEPAAYTVIILITAKLNQLLPTIKSRCQNYNVPSPSKEESIRWLKSHSNSEMNVEALLKITGNKPLNALNLTQQDIDDRKQFFLDLRTVIQQQLSISEVAKKWEKYDVEVLLNWQISLVSTNIKALSIAAKNTENERTPSMVMTQHLTEDQHWKLYQALIAQKQYIHTSVNSLIFTENMIMLWLKSV